MPTTSVRLYNYFKFQVAMVTGAAIPAAGTGRWGKGSPCRRPRWTSACCGCSPAKGGMRGGWLPLERLSERHTHIAFQRPDLSLMQEKDVVWRGRGRRMRAGLSHQVDCVSPVGLPQGLVHEALPAPPAVLGQLCRTGNTTQRSLRLTSMTHDIAARERDGWREREV